jgi:cell division protease FtsH
MTAPEAPRPPAEGLTPPDEQPPRPEQATRKKMGLWDRIRILLLFVLAWLIIVWASWPRIRY